MFFQRRAFELPTHYKIIFEDGVFKVGELSVTGQLYCDVFVFLALIANTGFAMRSNQLVKRRTGQNVLVDDFLDQLLLELPILSVEIIALVARQHAGRIPRIETDMVTR
ncbi:hypothetical protein B0E42_20250 [Pseudomonas sp. A25(2017)]|nr:hypothetical protein B0E42_20250 [Pseudomonas sp. A25(2017)]